MAAIVSAGKDMTKLIARIRVGAALRRFVPAAANHDLKNRRKSVSV